MLSAGAVNVAPEERSPCKKMGIAVMKSRLGMLAATAALAEYLSGNQLVVSNGLLRIKFENEKR